MITNLQEYQDLIQRFEHSDLTLDSWHHKEHVAVAVWYLINYSEDEAIDKLRKGIVSLNEQLGIEQTLTSGYHETWTIFFTKMLNRHMANLADQGLDEVKVMNKCIEYLRDFKDVSRQYYSKELILSWEARKGWYPPDLKEL